MAYDGTIKFDTSLNASELQKGTGQMTKLFTTSFAAITVAAAAALTAIGKVGVGYNAQMEDYTTNFATMLGSQEAAIKKVEALKVMAAKTPFGMEDLAKGTQTLLAFGIQSDKTQVILQQIGDVALGDKGKFESLTLAFAQMSSTGRLMGQDLNQMINAGFNPLRVISEKTGKSIGQLKQEMEKGAITSEMVAEAFAIATSAGGTFYNGMEAASKTLHGQWSTLQDDAAATAGTLFLPFNNVLSSRVLPNIIDLVGDLNDNLSSPKMQSAMTKISEGLGDLIEGAVKFASAALPPLISALSFLSRNMEYIIPITGTLFALWKANQFAGYAKVIKGVTDTTVLLTAAENGNILAKTKAMALTVKDMAVRGGQLVQQGLFAVALGAETVATKLNTAATNGGIVAKAAAAVAAKVAAAAQWVWNAAMSANPIGLLIAGVAALVVGIIALVSWLDTSSAAYKREKEDLKELREEHKGYADALAESKNAASAESQKKIAQVQGNRTLIASLNDLIAKNDAAGQNNVLIANTVDQLNQSVEGLGLAFDETTGQINMSAEELAAYGENLEKVTQYEAAQDEYNNILAERNDLQAKINTLEDKKVFYQQLVDKQIMSQEEANRLIEDANSLLGDYGDSMVALEADVQFYQNAVEEAYNAEAEIAVRRQEIVNNQFTDAKRLAHQYGMTADEVLDAAAQMEGGLDAWAAHMEATHTKEGLNLEQLAAKWGTTTEAITAEMDEAGLSMQEWSDQQQEAWDTLQSAISTHSDAIINSFKEIPAEYEMSAQEMIDVLAKNRERYAEWQAAMSEISGQVSAETLAELQKLGPGALSAIQEMQANGGAGLAEFDALIRGTIDDSTAYAIGALNDPELAAAAGNMPTDMGQAVTSNPALTEAATTMVTNAKAEIENQVGVVDFSTVGQTIANDIVRGVSGADMSGMMASVANAVRGGTGSVTAAVTSMSTSVQSVFTTMSTNAKSAVTSMMADINSTVITRASTIRVSITSMGNGIVTALNSAKTQAVNVITSMMTGINSAIVTRAATVKASMTSCANGVVSALTDMKTKGENLATQMMTGINSAIVTRTGAAKSSATAVSNGIVSALEGMVSGGTGAANNMMDGMLGALNAKASGLYAKAREIANNIAQTLRAAWDEHSPSRVSYKIMEFFMRAMYNAMGDLSGLLYRRADTVAGGLTERLTLSPDVFSDLYDRLESVTFNPLGGAALVPAAAYAGGNGNTVFSPTLIQNVTTPKPMSPSELTREGQDMLRRQRWQLP